MMAFVLFTRTSLDLGGPIKRCFPNVPNQSFRRIEVSKSAILESIESGLQVIQQCLGLRTFQRFHRL